MLSWTVRDAKKPSNGHLEVDCLEVPGLLYERPRLLEELVSHGPQLPLVHLYHALHK